VLLNVSGAANVSLVGLGFRDSAITYLEPHSLPSSGDWAIARQAAVFLEGTDDALISNCSFLRLDGVALMLSGRNRGAEVSDSHFAFLGESAIALWGHTSGGPLPLVGPDTRDGNQPRGTRILRNIFREFGIFEKQSSAYFRAEAGLTTFQHNWVFNGPRAGINLNDGALGGDLIDSNVLANQCRESGDHGPMCVVGQGAQRRGAPERARNSLAAFCPFAPRLASPRLASQKHLGPRCLLQRPTQRHHLGH
jgi:hypothetical protein